MANVYTTNPMVLDTFTSTTTDLVNTPVTIKGLYYENGTTSNLVVISNSKNEEVARIIGDGTLQDLTRFNVRVDKLRLHSGTDTGGVGKLLIYV